MFFFLKLSYPIYVYYSGGFQNNAPPQQQHQQHPPQPGFNPAAPAPSSMPQPPVQAGFNPAAAQQQHPGSAGFYPQGPGGGGPPKPPSSSPNLGPMQPPQMHQPPPQQQQPGMMMQQQPGPPGVPQQQQHEIFQENIDYSIKVPERILRLTSQYIPSSANLGHGCKVPLGAIIKPLAGVTEDDEEDVCVVQPGAAGIVRCKRYVLCCLFS